MNGLTNPFILQWEESALLGWIWNYCSKKGSPRTIK